MSPCALCAVQNLKIVKSVKQKLQVMLSLRAGRAFLDLRSRVPNVLGTRARGNAIFFKARGNAERKEVGTLISRA